MDMIRGILQLRSIILLDLSVEGKRTNVVSTQHSGIDNDECMHAIDIEKGALDRGWCLEVFYVMSDILRGKM